MIALRPVAPPPPTTASMPLRHGVGGGGRFPLLSLSTFGAARFLMAIAVFFCHVFERFNDFGFLFVSVFVFMSGYGLDYTRKREFSLYRLIPFLAWFVFFSLFAYFSFARFPFPSYWFFVLYFVCSLLYRISFSLKSFFLFSSFLFLFFYSLDFSLSYYICFLAFPLGLFVSRYPQYFTFVNCLSILPLILLLRFGFLFGIFAIVPLFTWIVLRLSSYLSIFSFLGSYTFYFYAVHVFILSFFSSTWTLGGSPEFWGVFLSFLISSFLSWFLRDFFFKLTTYME